MKKVILVLFIIFIGLLGYSFYKQNELKKENQWLYNQYYKENPEIYFESNIEDSTKKTCYQIGDGTYHLLDSKEYNENLLGGVFFEVEDSYCK